MANPDFKAFARTLSDLASRKGNSPLYVPCAKVEKMLGRKLTREERIQFTEAYRNAVERIFMGTAPKSERRRAK